MMPAPPRPSACVNRHAAFLSHIEGLGSQLATQRSAREVASRAARAAQEAAALALHRRQNGDPSGSSEALRVASRHLVDSLAGRSEDEETFSAAAQVVVAAQTFDAFLVTGTLGARPMPSEEWLPIAPEPAPVIRRHAGEKAPRLEQAAGQPSAQSALSGQLEYTDEEWLGGLISGAHEIGRYAGVAATHGDVTSVRKSRAVVAALHEHLMGFDFRNGPLRRSFDSLKYVVP